MIVRWSAASLALTLVVCLAALRPGGCERGGAGHPSGGGEIRIDEPPSGAVVDSDYTDVSVVVSGDLLADRHSLSLCVFTGGLLLDCVAVGAFDGVAAAAGRFVLAFEFGPLRGALERPARVHCELRRGDDVVTASRAVTYWLAPRAPPPPPPPSSATEARGLAIALHAQRSFARHGVVAGSEVTCRGMRAALEAMPSVGHVELFSPLDYEAGLSARAFDIVLVEGHVPSVPAFIAAARAMNPAVVVLYVVLDTYPTPLAVMRIDADGFLTNSGTLEASLEPLAPTQFMLLAADPEVMKPATNGGLRESSPAVVYVGQMSIHKGNLTRMLMEARAFDLAIYGVAWESYARELVPFLHGVLPLERLPAVYAAAGVVLATTDDAQRALGMINNRIFEAMACGAVVVADWFPELQAVFQDRMVYVRERGDTQAVVRELLRFPILRARIGARARAFVVANHTWTHRMADALAFAQRLGALEDGARRPRRNRPLVLVLVDAAARYDAMTRFVSGALRDSPLLRLKFVILRNGSRLSGARGLVCALLARGGMGVPTAARVCSDEHPGCAAPATSHVAPLRGCGRGGRRGRGPARREGVVLSGATWRRGGGERRGSVRFCGGWCESGAAGCASGCGRWCRWLRRAL